MNEDRFDGLISSRKEHPLTIGSTAGVPRNRKFSQEDPIGQESMLLDDIRLQVLPYGRGSDDGFTLAIEPANEETTRFVHSALDGSGSRFSQLQESFREYITDVVWLLARGDVYLDIEYFHARDDEAGKPVDFRIALLEPGLVTRRFWRYSYPVPSTTKGEEAVQWSSKPLDPHCLVVVSLPQHVRRDLNHALRAIRISDQDMRVMTDFTTGKHGSSSGFDFRAYQRLSHDVVLRASRSIGWTGRGILAEDLLDPEKAWRAIQFSRLTVTLREAAMRGLQEVIARASDEIGFSATLELTGVLTLSDLDNMEDDLKAGTRPMSELLHPGS